MLVYTGSVTTKQENPLKKDEKGKPIEVTRKVSFSLPLAAIKAVDDSGKRWKPTELNDGPSCMANLTELAEGNEQLIAVCFDFARIALAGRRARANASGLAGDTKEEKEAARGIRRLQKAFGEVCETVFDSLREIQPEITLEQAQESVLRNRKAYKPLKEHFEGLSEDSEQSFDWSSDFPYLGYMTGKPDEDDEDEESSENGD